MILSFVLVVATLLVTIELVHRLRILGAFSQLAHVGLRAGRFLFQKGSDRWKERGSLKFSLLLLGTSFRALKLVLFAIFPFAFLGAAQSIIDFGLWTMLDSRWCRILIGVTGLSYAIIRNKHT